jgi:hypothetical protein
MDSKRQRVRRVLSFGVPAKTAVSIFKNLEEAKRIDSR